MRIVVSIPTERTSNEERNAASKYSETKVKAVFYNYCGQRLKSLSPSMKTFSVIPLIASPSTSAEPVNSEYVIARNKESMDWKVVLVDIVVAEEDVTFSHGKSFFLIGQNNWDRKKVEGNMILIVVQSSLRYIVIEVTVHENDIQVRVNSILQALPSRSRFLQFSMRTFHHYSMVLIRLWLQSEVEYTVQHKIYVKHTAHTWSHDCPNRHMVLEFVI